MKFIEIRLNSFSSGRFLFGPRLVQLAELSTAVVLLLGAAERLGPNANAAVCSSALFAWAAAFLASRPREFQETQLGMT